MNEQIKSTKIAGVDCKIGRNARTGSTVTMTVTDQFIMEAVSLFETREKGNKPKEGLIGLELHAVYAEDLASKHKKQGFQTPNDIEAEKRESFQYDTKEGKEAGKIVDGMEGALDEVAGDEKK